MYARNQGIHSGPGWWSSLRLRRLAWI
ncbi:hypothetical protein ID866_7117 [Astraeus odoratus]|nr:hypothetical protein ID866_7117 [Astraeus odoratus]